MIRLDRELWLCLHLHALALEVFDPPRADQPLAVVEKQRVYLSTEQQLEPGLALATAHALCADLAAIERQPAREQETLRDLAHWAYRFTPTIAIGDDNCLLLEIGGCRRLYRGINPLLERLQNELNTRGHRAAIGLAHTPKAAWLLARSGHPCALNRERLDAALLQRQLGEVLTALLPVEEKIAAGLAQMGINTLGELLALPQAALGKRFGAPFIRYLQQLTGHHPDPQPAFEPAPRFERGLNFIDGVHNRQTLLFPMKRLVQSLCDYLQARQFHCRALHWYLYDAHQVQAEMTIELTRAQNRWRTFLDLSQLRLDTLPLRDAVYSLALCSESFNPAAPGTLNLFDGDIAPGQADTALLDRLQARLGTQALQRLRTCASHWPEQAQQTLPAGAAAKDAEPVAGPRPLWLLPQPKALRRRGEQLFWENSLQLLRGPERIGNIWWQEKMIERDYYVAQAADGRLCWVFRELHSNRWFVHGLFA